METAGLVAPHLMPAEVTNVLRKLVTSGSLSAGTARMAHDGLGSLPVELFGYDAFAERVWALRKNVTAYDAWYVALAESLDAPLITLDLRLTRAPGPTCEFVTPGDG